MRLDPEVIGVQPHERGDFGVAAATLVAGEAIGGGDIIIAGVETAEHKIKNEQQPLSPTYQCSVEEYS